MTEFSYHCPKCNKNTDTNAKWEKMHCSDCGTLMVEVSAPQQAEQEIIEPETAIKREPEITEKEVQSFKSDFEFNSPIAINESKSGKTIISGTLLSEGLSTNGNLYTIETLEQLDGLTDIPIFVGTGISNKHSKASGVIGKILKTIFDRVKRKVLFIAEITNKAIAESVRSGWGISIGGNADGSIVLDSAGKILTKIKSLVLNHVQLLMPSTARGMSSAKVESVQIQETMTFGNMPKLSKSQIAQIVASLIAQGEIKID